MVDLPQVSPELVTSKAPQSGVSPGQIASPYQMLGHALDKLGDMAEKIAEPLAEKAGYGAVTRDENGNIKVEKAPIIGPAMGAYSRAVKMGALAEGEGAAKRADIGLRAQFRDNPEGYAKAADEFKQGLIDQYTKAAGPEVGFAIGRAVDATTTMTYRGLKTEAEHLDLQRSEFRITAGIASAKDDAIALARQGDTNSPEFIKAVNTVHELTQEKTGIPRLAYPQEKAQYDIDQFHGELKANGFLHHIDDVYKDQGIDANGQPKGGRAAALEAAKSVLQDPSLKLTEQQRTAYYHKAVGEVHANEALRKADVSEARTAASELSYASAIGVRIEPAEVDRVGDAFRKAGDPGGAARFFASFTRKPLNDDQGRRPLDQQAADLNGLHAAAGLTEAVKRFEGFESVAKPDYKQLSVGYGTKANFPGEQIDKPEAERRLGVELSRAQKAVDAFQPDLPPGVRAALTSLTYNAGTAWMGSGLGKKIMAGDFQGAKENFLEYNKAGDRLNYGLVSRRQQEVQWFDNGGPAASSWLIANRQHALETQSRGDWKEVMKGWEEKGIRPNDQAVNKIVDAARATGDSDLLDRIGHDMERVEVVQTATQRSLPQQEATLTELKRAGQSGALAPGQEGVIKDMQARYDAVSKGLETNPIATTVANFPDRFGTPAPLDLSNDQNFQTGMRQRQALAQFATNNWQTRPVQALDKADLEQVRSVLDNGKPTDKAHMMANLVTGLTDEGVRAATLHKLGEGDPSHMASSWAGSLMAEGDVETAKSIFRGQEAIKVDKRFEKYGKEDDFAADLGKHMPPTAFSEADRTQHDGAYATAVRAIKDVYADMSQRAGDTSGVADKDRLEAAINKVTGGVHEHNGGKFIAPVRGQSQAVTDKLIWAVDDNDMKGVTTPAGESVGVDYLRSTAKLESVGDGRYALRLGSDPDRPIYAYQGKDKFVLDLRHKAPGIDSKPMVSPPPAVNF